MKNKNLDDVSRTLISCDIKIILATLAVSLLVPGLVYADVNTTLYIQDSEGLVLVNTSLIVPESCSVVDNVGVSHDFSGHRAPCALQAAKDTGVIADFLFKDFGGLGLFLDSVNDIASGPAPDFPYWNLWRNGIFSDVGISEIVLFEGDAFQLTYGPFITEIIQAVAPDSANGGPVVFDVFPRKMDVENAISFLTANQQQNGSFGHPLFSDWAAVAFGAYEGESSSAFYAINALKEWFMAHPVSEGSILTDYERRAMALMSLGINPYSGTDINYIEAIMQGFDGQQFGSLNLVNDDIFAVLVLQKAGYEANVTPLLETLPFILSWQRENGSFGSGDLTSAAIQALSLFPKGVQRDEALRNAREYLASQQESTGGFGNVYSTSWALQAIVALEEDGDAWAMEVDRRTPEHFLALRQALDGGLLKEESKENRIWATAYAIPAVLQKSWGDVLQDFKQPAVLTVVPQNEEELTQGELDAFQAQIEMLQNEIARIQAKILATLQLKEIQREVSRIASEVKVLQPKVASLHAAYLAQLKLPQDKGLAKEQQPDKLSQFNILEGGTIVLGEEPTPTKKEGDRLTAEVAGTARNFFTSSTGQAALALGVGIVLFLAFGGWRVVLSLVRRPRTAI